MYVVWCVCPESPRHLLDLPFYSHCTCTCLLVAWKPLLGVLPLAQFSFSSLGVLPELKRAGTAWIKQGDKCTKGKIKEKGEKEEEIGCIYLSHFSLTISLFTLFQPHQLNDLASFFSYWRVRQLLLCFFFISIQSHSRWQSKGKTKKGKERQKRKE